MEKKLNNGKTYRFEEVCKGYILTYCFYDGKWNHISKDFTNWTEVENWINRMNTPVENTTNVVMTNKDYFSITGYYGD